MLDMAGCLDLQCSISEQVFVCVPTDYILTGIYALD